MTVLMKWVAYLLLAFLLFHWFTAGQDEIIEGPPETPDGLFLQHEPTQ